MEWWSAGVMEHCGVGSAGLPEFAPTLLTPELLQLLNSFPSSRSGRQLFPKFLIQNFVPLLESRILLRK